MYTRGMTSGAPRRAPLRRRFTPAAFVLTTVCVLGAARDSAAYSALAHLAIVDAAWDPSIAPRLRARYPGATAEDLRRARAFAYGGSLIQDIGYYPFSSRFFGDLAHYVRGGDFVQALVREAGDVTEYAFALGAVAHYAADNKGHPGAVNRVVPLLYPKLRARHGGEVTYADSPKAHVRTEFGFDVLQVARGKYVSETYLDFIGFEVSKPVLERAFRATYGLELKDVFSSLDLAIGTFRWTVSTTIPAMTRVAWELKHDDIVALTPDATREGFLFSQTRPQFETAHGTNYRRPGFIHKLLALLLRIVPKIGPFQALAFKPPTPEAERLFVESFAATVDEFRTLTDAASSSLDLENRNFDTGRPVRAGDYRLVDETYARLARQLAEQHTKGLAVLPDIRENVLAFYSDLNAPIETKRDRQDWARLLRDLDFLKAQASRRFPTQSK